MNASSRASRRCRSDSQSSPVVSSTTLSSVGSGEQDARLLERLAHRRAHQRPRVLRGRPEQVGPLLGAGPDPADLLLEVTRVDAAAREDAEAAGERHPTGAPEQVDLEPALLAVARPAGARPCWRPWARPACGCRRRTRARAARGARAAAPSGPLSRPRRSSRPRRGRPAAAPGHRPRTARGPPASPKTSPTSSDAPLATPGWPVKSGVEATKTTSFTIRRTWSSGTSALIAARALRAHCCAHSFGLLRGHRAADLAGRRAARPQRSGSWPAVKTWLPLRTAGTYAATGLATSGHRQAQLGQALLRGAHALGRLK